MPDKIKKHRRFSNDMQKYKLLYVLLAAVLTVLTVLALMMLLRLHGRPQSIMVKEQNGVYDLNGIKDLEKESVRLEPGTSYYPNLYLTPENADTTVCESVDHFEEIRVEYLSQRFVLKLPDNSDTYTMTFNLSGRHAMRVFVNGRLAGQTGNPGTTKQDTQVWENNITFHAAAVNGEMDIILNSAQFNKKLLI